MSECIYRDFSSTRVPKLLENQHEMPKTQLAILGMSGKSRNIDKCMREAKEGRTSIIGKDRMYG